METQLQPSVLPKAPKRIVFDNQLAKDLKVRHSITIECGRAKVFAYWRDIKSGLAQWHADITEEKENAMLVWTSRESAEVKTKGTIIFEDGLKPEQTVVRFAMDYSLPGGKLTEWARFFKGEDPDTLAIKSLKHGKAYLEAGEIPTTEGQPSGRKDKQ